MGAGPTGRPPFPTPLSKAYTPGSASRTHTEGATLLDVQVPGRPPGPDGDPLRHLPHPDLVPPPGHARRHQRYADREPGHPAPDPPRPPGAARAHPAPASAVLHVHHELLPRRDGDQLQPLSG